MPDQYQSLSHSKWDCKYHVVLVPKGRRAAVYGQIRQHLGAIFHALARQKDGQILEGHVMSDHVHMMIQIPPKYAVESRDRLSEREKRHCHRTAMRADGNGTSTVKISGHVVTGSPP